LLLYVSTNHQSSNNFNYFKIIWKQLIKFTVLNRTQAECKTKYIEIKDKFRENNLTWKLSNNTSELHFALINSRNLLSTWTKQEVCMCFRVFVGWLKIILY
jgi:hypothetical protein